MDRPRFSEMLVRRRRELGLSTAQASQVLKIKEQVLIAFEEGDFESIPKSGYAQGMLSSYARYLGLNARQLVDVFQEELYEHINGEQSHELRRRTRDVREGRDIEGYETVNEAQSRPKAYVGAPGLLPTSGGPAGDYGEFATTSKASPRSGSVQLVNSGRTTSLYATGNASYARGASIDPSNTAAMGSHSQFVNGHSNNARGQSQRGEGSRRSGSQTEARRRRSDANRSARSGRAYDDLRRENVRTRRANAEGRDSRGAVESYEPATSLEARRRSRGASAQAPARPNVQRGAERQSRTSGRRGAQGQGRRRGNNRGRAARSAPARMGGIGLIIVLAVTVVLTVTVILGVQSCTSQRETEQTTSVPVATTTTSGTVGTQDESEETTSTRTTTSDDEDDSSGTSTSASTDDSTTSSEGDASPDVDETGATDSTSENVVQLEVSIESGQQAWVEITVDGVSRVADRYTGPWSATYEVGETAIVQADNTAAVTVTADDVPQSFSGKASGVGSITIEVPQSETDDDASEDSSATEDTTTQTTTSY